MKHEINSQNTKIMLAEALISLLSNKPLAKITVSELVSLCNINRKTFYYHFTDIYDLLEWYLNNEVEKALNLLDPLENFNEVITYSLNYMQQHTCLRNCIDTPLGRDKITLFLNKHLEPNAYDIITRLEDRYHKKLDTAFKHFLVNNMTQITTLSIINAIEHPNKSDADTLKLYLSNVFEAFLDGFFRKKE